MGPNVVFTFHDKYYWLPWSSTPSKARPCNNRWLTDVHDVSKCLLENTFVIITNINGNGSPACCNHTVSRSISSPASCIVAIVGSPSVLSVDDKQGVFVSDFDGRIAANQSATSQGRGVKRTWTATKRASGERSSCVDWRQENMSYKVPIDGYFLGSIQRFTVLDLCYSWFFNCCWLTQWSVSFTFQK